MTSPKFRIMAITAAMLFSTAASADECDSKAAEGAAKIGGTVVSRMVIGISIEHPNVQVLGVGCEDHKATLIVAESREKTPRADYYETVGRFIAAAFPAITSTEASSEALRCQTMARSREREWAASEIKSLRFQCRFGSSDNDRYGPVLAVHLP